MKKIIAIMVGVAILALSGSACIAETWSPYTLITHLYHNGDRLLILTEYSADPTNPECDNGKRFAIDNKYDIDNEVFVDLLTEAFLAQKQITFKYDNTLCPVIKAFAISR